MLNSVLRSSQPTMAWSRALARRRFGSAGTEAVRPQERKEEASTSTIHVSETGSLGRVPQKLQTMNFMPSRSTGTSNPNSQSKQDETKEMQPSMDLTKLSTVGTKVKTDIPKLDLTKMKAAASSKAPLDLTKLSTESSKHKAAVPIDLTKGNRNKPLLDVTKQATGDRAVSNSSEQKAPAEHISSNLMRQQASEDTRQPKDMMKQKVVSTKESLNTSAVKKAQQVKETASRLDLTSLRDEVHIDTTATSLNSVSTLGVKPVIDLTKPVVAHNQGFNHSKNNKESHAKRISSDPAAEQDRRKDATHQPSHSKLSASERLHRQQEKEFSKPVAPTAVTLPADQEEMSMKSVAELTNLSLDRLLWNLVELGGSETQSILPPRVLEKIRGGRTTSRGAVNAAAAALELPMDTVELLLLEMGVNVNYAADENNDRRRSGANATTPKRAPIVVVMGHVDHGKTTLLDALRKTDIAKCEQGGITQSIAGFKVDLANGQSACFLDTPGHEAFSSMRKSGTAVTDVACVVVAATDGVMPQTIESIKYARAAKLPIVFAVTKMDMAKARASSPLTNEDIEAKIVDQLNVSGLYDENADVFVPVVAPQGEGLDELVEAIMLQVDLNESRFLSRCPENAPGEAVVLESKVDRAFGSVADVVVRWGTLKVGDYVVCDQHWARIRRLVNSSGNAVPAAPPATPIRVCGFDACLPPGSDVLVVADEKECKRIIDYRQKRQLKIAEREAKRKLLREEQAKRAEGTDEAKEKKLRATRREKAVQRKQQQEKLEEVLAEHEERRTREFRVILKADAEGSLNALTFAVKQMKEKGELPEEHNIVIVKSAVGQLSDQDLELAKTTDAYILGFNLKLPGSIAKKAKVMNVLGVSTHPVIYNLLEDFAENCLNKKDKHDEAEEKAAVVKGSAQVLDIFELKGKDKKQVAGIRVLDGVMNKNDMFVVKRDGVIVAEFKFIDSLRILKKDVPLVEKGAECGLALKDFAGFQVGDIIEAKEASAQSPSSPTKA